MRVTDANKTLNALLLTDVCMIGPLTQDIAAVERAVYGWTGDQRDQAYQWAIAEHLHANEEEGVHAAPRLPVPPHVQELRR